jgi:hypothetical protein
VIDEVPARRAEAHAGCLGLQIVQQRLEARLGLGGVRGPIGPIGVGRERVGNVAEDLGMALDPARGPSAVPVGLERLGELVKERSGELGDGIRSPPLA